MSQAPPTLPKSSFFPSFSTSFWVWCILGTIVIILVSFWVGTQCVSNPLCIEIESDRAITLVRTYDQNPNYNPITIEVLSNHPKMLLLHDFLDPSECDQLIQMGNQSGFGRSTVQGKTNEVSQDRTSHTHNFRRGENDLIQKIEKRVTCFSGLPPENTEPFQIVKYSPGEEYKAHYDFFVPGAVGTDIALRRGGQRYVTFFVYLNDMDPSEKGAHTEFPKLNLKIQPKKGMAAYWMNVLPDTKEDFRTLHSGKPPASGIKYGLNIWVRANKFM